ncbi:sensor histidine kinase [Butyrivibrio sp. FCS014]|uniref:sensor histidine kinase n=1 Tax=Butyrivibrio sp. FCS014 TaxID=1408304 RepID=UPI000467B704|nr:sensor histidine kinase [Butyrivibrio sp. FCS014]
MGFVRQSFKRQIFVVFLAVTLFLVIFGGILTVQGFQARIRADYEKRDAEQEAVAIRNINDILDKSGETLDLIAASDVLLDSFYKGRKNSIAIYADLYDATRQVRPFAQVDLYMGSRCMYSTASVGKPEALPDYYGVLYEAVKAGGRTVFSQDMSADAEGGGDLIIARLMVNKEEPGVALIRIDQQVLRDRISGSINARDGFMLTGSFLEPYCLVGTAEDGKDLSSIRSNLLGGKLYTDGFDKNVYMKELGNTGLLGIYITPPPLDESAVRAGYQIILLLAVISVAVCLFVANRMSNYVSKPIGILASGMKRFRKGDFDTKIEIDREDEFEQLAVGFNKMTTQLKDTMEERVAAERKVNETRIEMMQAQLNPHFLYNTLDTIKWVAKVNGVQEVATMSASLAGILRTSISQKQFCTLSQEIKLVENYCDIQRIRFDDKFDITIDIPDEVMEAVIPKLILQPIVENAIIHGMDEMEHGHIYMAALKQAGSDGSPDLLKISVQDDGKGISDEMLNALNNDDPETLKGHLGLNNVNTIIRLYYGKEYGVMAVRPTQGGTVMIVTLPYQEKEPET